MYNGYYCKAYVAVKYQKYMWLVCSTTFSIGARGVENVFYDL